MVLFAAIAKQDEYAAGHTGVRILIHSHQIGSNFPTLHAE
jgi:hypothetical protein